MVIRFKESVRVRVWGRELSNFRKGEIHAVPTAVAGVLLAQGCAEPVSDDTTPELRQRQLGFERFQSPIEVGDGLFQHGAMRGRARVLEIAQCSRTSEHQRRPLGAFPDLVGGHGLGLRSAGLRPHPAAPLPPYFPSLEPSSAADRFRQRRSPRDATWREPPRARPAAPPSSPGAQPRAP